jgi:hypothetical protein
LFIVGLDDPGDTSRESSAIKRAKRPVLYGALKL